jgi:Phage late control gene D protein (GPD).
MNVELIIQRGEKVYEPTIVDKIDWKTERYGVPGQLKFNILKSDIQFEEGDAVRLKINDKNVFYGFIFTKKTNKDMTIGITAYDQLRYLKNKDTYVYKNKRADEVVRMIADDFQLQLGELENTSYIIASKIEDNTTLFDIIQNTLDDTIQYSKEMFVLFDDFGKLSLKNIRNMAVGLLVDEDTAENFDYTSSIDSETYNRVKLAYENEETGTRDIYISQHGENMNKWGILQYFDTLKEGEQGKQKADALLSLYNRKTKNLKITNAYGDLRVRAGSMIPVQFDLGDAKLNNYMIVEKCTHKFEETVHLMDLVVRGGDFIA